MIAPLSRVSSPSSPSGASSAASSKASSISRPPSIASSPTKACQALPNDVKERIERGKRSIGRCAVQEISPSLQYDEFVLFSDRLAAIAKFIAYGEERAIRRRAGAKADAG